MCCAGNATRWQFKTVTHMDLLRYTISIHEKDPESIEYSTERQQKTKQKKGNRRKTREKSAIRCQRWSALEWRSCFPLKSTKPFVWWAEHWEKENMTKDRKETLCIHITSHHTYPCVLSSECPHSGDAYLFLFFSQFSVCRSTQTQTMKQTSADWKRFLLPHSFQMWNEPDLCRRRRFCLLLCLSRVCRFGWWAASFIHIVSILRNTAKTEITRVSSLAALLEHFFISDFYEKWRDARFVSDSEPSGFEALGQRYEK